MSARQKTLLAAYFFLALCGVAGWFGHTLWIAAAATCGCLFGGLRQVARDMERRGVR